MNLPALIIWWAAALYVANDAYTSENVLIYVHIFQYSTRNHKII